ncbi:hypothetical protein ABZX30_31425 [Streptomyces sp. NPDC004542]
MLCRLLSIPPAEYRRVFPRLENTAVSEVRIDGDTTSLLSLDLPCAP